MAMVTSGLVMSTLFLRDSHIMGLPYMGSYKVIISDIHYVLIVRVFTDASCLKDPVR